MTTTASEVYANVLLYKLNISQSQTFLIKIYVIFENNVFESAIQLFLIHHRITFATIQNPAVYLSGARVSIFSSLIP